MCALAALLGLGSAAVLTVPVSADPKKDAKDSKDAKAGDASEGKKPLSDKDRQARIDALEPFNALISEWRCDGVKPGTDRNKGGWSETCQWVWKLTPTEVSVRYEVTGSKTFTDGRLAYDPASEKFTFTANRVDGTKATYAGEFDDDKKNFTMTATLASGETEKVTIRFLDGIRYVMLIDRGKPGKAMAAVAEIGCTKKGEKIAGSSETKDKCIVTGGPSDRTVSTSLGTFPVCCSGCVDAVKADPAKWVANAKKKGYIK
jgi:hypothetical protein